MTDNQEERRKLLKKLALATRRKEREDRTERKCRDEILKMMEDRDALAQEG